MRKIVCGLAATCVVALATQSGVAVATETKQSAIAATAGKTKQSATAATAGKTKQSPTAATTGKTKQSATTATTGKTKQSATVTTKGKTRQSAAAAGAAKKKPPAKVSSLAGLASVYAYKKRSRSASGEIINFKSLVAAHRTLRFGTKVRVTNRRNGKSVIVRIIDRGPFIRGRVIDLSPAAAHEIGMGWGIAPVTLAVVGNRA